MKEKTFAENRPNAHQWTGRILMAVIFGLAIWNLIVSLISNVVVPWLGSLAGPNAGLPQSFARNYDYPDLFVAVLEFCVAGIVAISINWFFQRPGKARPTIQASTTAVPPTVRPAIPTPPVAATTPPVSPVPAMAVSVQPATAAIAPTPVATPSTVAFAGGAASKPAPAPIPAISPASPAVATIAPSVPKAEPVKPKKEKPVYYNIVGEPVPDDEN